MAGAEAALATGGLLAFPGFSWLLQAGQVSVPGSGGSHRAGGDAGAVSCPGEQAARKRDFSSVVLTLPLPAVQNQLFNPEDSVLLPSS